LDQQVLKCEFSSLSQRKEKILAAHTLEEVGSRGNNSIVGGFLEYLLKTNAFFMLTQEYQ
jgi:hypothetical protein